MITRCPYCKGRTQVNGRYREGAFELWWCSECSKPLFFENRTGSGGFCHSEQDIAFRYPWVDVQINESVPDRIARDLKESIICLGVGCYRASAVMSRRALQCVAVDKQGTGDTLRQQLRDIAAKGILRPALADLCDQIRLTGNVAAHPDEDGLEDIEKQDAEELISFMWAILEDLYVGPARVKAHKERFGRE